MTIFLLVEPGLSNCPKTVLLASSLAATNRDMMPDDKKGRPWAGGARNVGQAQFDREGECQ